MNNQRRKDITKIITTLREIEMMLGDCEPDIENIQNEEQESYENMPEGLQQSERGELSQSSIESLDKAHNVMSSLMSQFDEVIESLEQAQE